MTSQRLYDILTFVDSLDKKLKVQNSLEAVRTALDSLVSQPAQPQYQSSLAGALDAFTTAAHTMSETITPSQLSLIEEMGGVEFFDPLISEKVRSSIQTNAMTPSVARDFVQDLATRRAAFLETVRAARQALEKLKITNSGLQPGSADVSFLIPRDIFDNDLRSFAKELTFISRLIQDFTEAQTGKAEPVKLEQLSSSIPTVTLMADLVALGLLGNVINWFLNAWHKIEEIRMMRAKLADMGLKGTALKELDDQIETVVTDVVEESTKFVMKRKKDGEQEVALPRGERRNELDNSVRADIRRLFGQIERGLKVEFRAEAKADGEEEQKQLQEIANIAKELKFPAITNEPLLLNAGELLEGEIHVTKHSRKTTTTQKVKLATKVEE